MRTHIEAAICQNSLIVEPPTFNPFDYGWAKDPSSLCLIPTTVIDGLKLIPDDLLKIIHCGYSSYHQCKTQRCTCTESGLACSIFYECEDCVTCLNPWTPKTVAGAIRILNKKNKMNGLNKIQTCYFCCYFHYCC